MQPDAAKAIVRRYLDAFNADWERALRDFVDDEGLAEHIRQMEGAFPNYQLTADDMIAEQDKVAVRFHLRAVHRGLLMGISATGREVLVEGIIIYRLANGRIAEHWLQVDMPGLLQQLGAVPAAAAHG